MSRHLSQTGSKLITIIVVTSLLLTSCASIEESTGISQENIGRVVGGLTGGLIASQVADDDHKTLAILLGAAGGAWLGGKIAKSLSERDRQESEASMANTLQHTGDGEKVVWQSQSSTAQGTFTPKETRTEKKEIAVVRDTRVEELPPVELINKPYISQKSANVRSRPSTDSKRVGALAAGEAFTAVGKVVNADWIMVAKNGVTVGYVYAPLVAPNQTIASTEQPKIRKAVNLDEMEDENTQAQSVADVDLGGVDLDAMVVVDKMEVQTQCRTMDYSITNEKNKTEKGEFEACKGADGAWEIS